MPILRRPGIPDISNDLDPAVAGPLRAMKEQIEISNGQANRIADGWKRRSVTLGMLIKSGLLSEAQARRMFEDED